MATSVSDSRLEQRFKLWDVDNDGRIERSDFEAEAERIVKAFGEKVNSLTGSGLMHAYLNMYDFLAEQAGVGKEGLSYEQFSGVVNREMIGQGNAGFAKVLRPTITAIVQLCDRTGDGEINRDEFKRWIDAIGAGAGDAEESFRRIDVNNSGTLTVDELVNAVRDYHLGKSNTALLGV